MKQIEGCSAFFKSQAALLGPDNAAASAMSASISSQIQALHALQVQDAAALSTAIGLSSFADSQKAMLAIAVAQQLSKLTAAAADQKSRKCNQTLSVITAYLTANDWKKLHGDTNVSAKIAVVVDKLFKVGLTCPPDATVKCIVAVVAAAHCSDVEAGTWHSVALEMKSAVTLSLPASDEDGLQAADCNLKVLAHVAIWRQIVGLHQSSIFMRS